MRQPRADGHVDLVLLERLDRTGGRHVHDVEAGRRSLFAGVLEERRQQQQAEQVRQPDREGARRGGGVEPRIAFEHALDLAQHLPGRFRQFECPRGRLHAGGGTNQKLVLEEMPQARQGVAHGRLAEADPVGSPRHVLLAEQGVERYEQVEIDRPKVHVPAFPNLVFWIFIS